MLNGGVLIIITAALVTLTPLGDSIEQHRTFVVNPTTEHIDIGRASKNENKGLIAAHDNAWFDSPIMSRQHARFTVSTARQVCGILQPTIKKSAPSKKRT